MMKFLRTAHSPAKPLLLPLSLLVALWGVPAFSAASELVDAFNLALQNDRTYLNAQAEERLGQLDASRAGLSYLPTVFMDQGRSAFEKTNRTTLQAVQPLVDVDKYTAYKEAPVKAAYAQASLEAKEIELTKRLFFSFDTLVKSIALRRLALSEAEALERQVQRAQRRFELGYGSVMDISLAQVQHAQALARYQSLQNDIQLAQQKLYSMTGVNYSLIKSQPVEELSPAALNALLKVAAAGGAEANAPTAAEHPLILQAKEQLKLAELSMTRAKSSYLPQVNLIVRNTQFAGMSDQYQGVQMSFPTGVSAYGMQATARAQVDVDRARRALEEVQEQLRLERESTDWALRVNAQELVFRNSAVKVSEQNVASTEKAYEAGIVKASDVVNAILASFDVRRQKLQLLISMSEQQLLNSLNRGVSSRAALEAVSHFFSE